jgi:RNA polymerase sigma-70 factor, ECF subfamily
MSHVTRARVPRMVLRQRMTFFDLYERYAGDVHRFALFLCGNHALAEDLTAETFVRAFSTKVDLKVDTVKAYLFAIARNLYRDVQRREGRFAELGEGPESADQRATPEVVAEGRSRLDAVLRAMQELPDGERAALVLAVDSDLSYERIAVILGCSIPAVKVRVHRARARLRAILVKEQAWRR